MTVLQRIYNLVSQTYTLTGELTPNTPLAYLGNSSKREELKAAVRDEFGLEVELTGELTLEGLANLIEGGPCVNEGPVPRETGSERP